MKHTVTDLDATNETVSFTQEELGMCFLESILGCYKSPQSLVTQDVQSEPLLATENPSTSKKDLLGAATPSSSSMHSDNLAQSKYET